VTSLHGVAADVEGGPARSAAPRILLFTPVAPVPSGVGGIFLHDLCSVYPASSLAVCVVTDTPERVRVPFLPPTRTLALARPPEYGFNRFGRRVTRATRAIAESYARRRYTSRLVDEAARFGRAHGVDLLWVPLSTPTALNAAAPLALSLGVPLVTTVWDPPEYWLPHYWGMEGRALRGYLGAFEEAMRLAVRCGAMSEAMAAEYESRFGTTGIVMRHGLEEHRWHPVASRVHDGDTLTIGFAGSLYTRDEWTALLRALDSTDWRVAGRSVRIRVCGPGWDLPLEGRSHIELLGWRTVDETVALMSECDLCYLPYWLDPRFAIATRLAFPTKLSTYLASGRPVLFHGPARSSPAQFFARYPAAVSCHSNAPADLVAAIAELIGDPDAYARAAMEGRRALSSELTVDLFRRRFADLVGVDVGVLATRAEQGSPD